MDSILYLQHDYSLPFLEDVVEIENILNNEVVSSCYGLYLHLQSSLIDQFMAIKSLKK